MCEAREAPAAEISDAAIEALQRDIAQMVRGSVRSDMAAENAAETIVDYLTDSFRLVERPRK